MQVALDTLPLLPLWSPFAASCRRSGDDTLMSPNGRVQRSYNNYARVQAEIVVHTAEENRGI